MWKIKSKEQLTHPALIELILSTVLALTFGCTYKVKWREISLSRHSKRTTNRERQLNGQNE